MSLIPALAAGPPLARARSHLERHDSRTLEWQARLSAIPAPTGAERARGDAVAELMDVVGLRGVQRDDAGNVTGWLGECRPDDAVVVAAHLDTVFGPEVNLTVRQAGSRLTGPGITDNARGLAAMLAVADAARACDWTTARAVLFAATVGEEGAGNLRGARHLFAHQAAHARAAIVVDGAGDDRVVHGALGSRRFRAGFRGPGGHSWSAFGIANPAHPAGAVAHAAATVPLPEAPRTTCAVTGLGGGTSLNSIPDHAWLEIDLRSEGAAALDQAEHHLRLAAERALRQENARRAPATPPLVLHWELLGSRPSGVTPANDELVRAALAATRAIGRHPVLATASTDANIPISLGIPAVAVGGGGRAGEAHRLTEWYENVEGPLGLYRLALILAAAGGLDGGGE
jgi:acetylornithine deacetylase/succinyl-diaminopimelate desuccinylase-like protein